MCRVGAVLSICSFPLGVIMKGLRIPLQGGVCVGELVGEVRKFGAQLPCEDVSDMHSG